MKSTTSLVARQCQLQEWANQISDCRHRPEGTNVTEWCRQNGITKTTYYYRLRQVRKACLDSIPQEQLPMATVNETARTVVAVPAALLNEAAETKSVSPELMVTIGKISILIKEDTSPDLLSMVLGVAAHVE